MRLPVFVFLLIGLPASAADVGEIFWEPGMTRAEDARELRYPGVREGGQASTGAALVAVIDSGVAAGHPQLGGYVVQARDFTGEGPQDDLGHGTALALVAVFGERSVETGVAILSAKVAGRSGRVREDDVIQAIDWAALRGAQVVHLRLGFRGSRREHARLCETIRGHWNVLFFASAMNVVEPTEVYPANCRVPNLYPTWANPAERPTVALAPDEVLGPGMTRLVRR